MTHPDDPPRVPTGLDAVLTTEELSRRPARPPDHAAEAKALGELAETLASAPRTILQKVADLTMGLCRADSAGISILEPGGGSGVFRWHAVAGRFAPNLDGTIARDASPCGVVIDRDAVLLFAYPERHFPYPVAVDPPIVETLLVPFHAGGQPVGTVWAIAHTPERKFDAEDVRLLRSLSRFAAAAHQTVTALDAAEAGRAERERTGELRASEERFRALVQNSSDIISLFDAAGTVVYQSPSVERLLGYRPEDRIGRNVFRDLIVHPDDLGTKRAFFGTVLGRPGAPVTAEFRLRHADGSWRDIEAIGQNFLDNPSVAGIVANYRDVTDRKRTEEALRAGEERLRLILESAVDYAIFTLAPDRTVTSWSPGAAATFGYSEGEMMGRSADVLFTPDDRAAGEPEKETETARREGRAADERWHVRKDGSRFYASGVLTPLGPGRAGGFVKVARDLTEWKRTEDELRRARDELEARVAERTTELARALESLEAEMGRRRDLARRLATAQEDERRRLARDLHDTVGQTLTALSLAAAAGNLERVRRRAAEVGRELHELAVRLRPTALDDVGLGAALGQLVSEWSARTGVPAELATPGLEAGRLPPEVETVLYRVVQEALTNAARHAGATRLSVVVGRFGDVARATVEDDGVGFDPDAGGRGRLGLLGMRERLALVGGELEVESAPGSGTAVHARVPLGGGP